MNTGTFCKIQSPVWGSSPSSVWLSDSRTNTLSSPILKDDQRLKLACQEFESIFIQYMIKVMRESSQKGYLGFAGRQMEIYGFLMDQELAKKIARQGAGIGLANKLYTILSNKIGGKN
jgi:flagellar protein FlgJ